MKWNEIYMLLFKDCKFLSWLNVYCMSFIFALYVFTAQEETMRVSFEPPVVERPTRADELTVKIFESKMQGEDRMSLAIMPRDSMPDSKYAIMSRLRDMNSQLAAIDHMSNNIEREFKNTRLVG